MQSKYSPAKPLDNRRNKRCNTNASRISVSAKFGRHCWPHTDHIKYSWPHIKTIDTHGLFVHKSTREHEIADFMGRKAPEKLKSTGKTIIWALGRQGYMHLSRRCLCRCGGFIKAGRHNLNWKKGLYTKPKAQRLQKSAFNYWSADFFTARKAFG